MTLLKSVTVTALMGAGLLAACGGGDAAEPEQTIDPTDVNALVQEQLEQVSDVEIKDKKSLNKNARIANDYLQGMDQVVSALEKVNDQAGAEKAAETMAEVGQKFDKLAEELDGAGANRERAMAMAMMSRQQELIAVQQRMAANMMRIQSQHPELMPVIAGAMSDLTP